MSKVIDTIIIRQEDLKVRKKCPPPGKVIRDKTKYNRKKLKPPDRNDYGHKRNI